MSGQLDFVESLEQLFEGHPELHPRKIGTDAEMRPPSPEGHMWIGVPMNIETEWISKYTFVAIRRRVRRSRRHKQRGQRPASRRGVSSNAAFQRFVSARFIFARGMTGSGGDFFKAVSNRGQAPPQNHAQPRIPGTYKACPRIEAAFRPAENRSLHSAQSVSGMPIRNPAMQNHATARNPCIVSSLRGIMLVRVQAFASYKRKRSCPEPNNWLLQVVVERSSV